MKKNYLKPTMRVHNITPCNVIAASSRSIPVSKMTIPTFKSGGLIETNEVTE